MLFRPVIAASLLVPVFAATALAASTPTVFRDIPAGHWAKRPAGVIADAQIMPGRTPVDFAGEAILTRFELAKILSELYGIKGPSPTFIVLRDLPPGHYATEEVQRVLGYNLMGLRNGQFAGEQPVSRKEAVIALDNLLQKNGIRPPARREKPIYFTDVKIGDPLDPVLERIVNRYALIDAPPRSRFNPNNGIKRYDMLAMLVKALPYVRPNLVNDLKEPPTPAPTLSLAPGQTPPPATPSTGSIFESPAPATPVPMRPAGPAALFGNQAWGGLDALLLANESLPTEAGATGSGENKSFAGGMLGGGQLGASYWSAPYGGVANVRSFYLPLDLTYNGKTVPVDVVDTFAQVGGYYQLDLGPDQALGVGGGALLRVAYNTTGSIVNLTYMSADKTTFGLGPSAVHAWRLSPELALVSQLTVYPLMMQSYQLGSASRSLTRFGLDAASRAEYALGPSSYAFGGAHAYFAGGSGTQLMLGLNAGAGLRF